VAYPKRRIRFAALSAKKRQRMTRAEQREETRTRLLDAAITVCSRRGLQAATLEEISEAAGFTRGALYSNFQSKEELLLALFEERIEPRLSAIAGPMIEAENTSQQAEAATGLVRALLTEERRYLLLLLDFWGFAARHPRVRRRFARVRQDRRARVADMLEERVKRIDGDLRVPPPDLAAAFVAATIGVLFEALVDPELDGAELHDMLFRLIARGASPGA
jgi:AcrR family transcriptional regulator